MLQQVPLKTNENTRITQDLRDCLPKIESEELRELKNLNLNNEFRQAELERILNPSNITKKVIEGIEDNSVTIMQEAYKNIHEGNPELAVKSLEKLIDDSITNFDQKGFFIRGQEELCLYLKCLAHEKMGDNKEALFTLESIYKNRAYGKYTHVHRIDPALLTNLTRLSRLCGEHELSRSYSKVLESILSEDKFVGNDLRNKSAYFQIALSKLKEENPDHTAIVNALAKSVGSSINLEHQAALELLKKYNSTNSPIASESKDKIINTISPPKESSELVTPEKDTATEKQIKYLDSLQKEIEDSTKLSLLKKDQIQSDLIEMNKELLKAKAEVKNYTDKKETPPNFVKLKLERAKIERAVALVLLNRNTEALKETYNLTYKIPEGAKKDDTALARFVRAKAYANLDLMQEAEDEIYNVFNLSERYKELYLMRSSAHRDWGDTRNAYAALEHAIGFNRDLGKPTIGEEEPFEEHATVSLLRMNDNTKLIKADYETGMLELKTGQYQNALLSFTKSLEGLETKLEYSYGIASLKALIWLREECKDESLHDAKEAKKLKLRLDSLLQ